MVPEKTQNLPHVNQEKDNKKEKQPAVYKKTRDSKVAIEWVRRRINEMVVG